MGRAALYGAAMLIAGAAVFLLSIALFIVLPRPTIDITQCNGMPCNEIMIVKPWYATLTIHSLLSTISFLALIVAAFGILLIIFDFLFLSNMGRAKRAVRYDPITNMKVGVGLTAYNDELAIGGAVKDFKENVEGLVDLVVIDNNCKDRTAEVARKAGARVVQEEKQGYGYACMRAMQEAAAKPGVDVIILCEGDGTFSAADSKKLLAYIENADMVVGTRTVVEVLDPDSQVDWFINWGNKFIARMLQLRYWGKVRMSDVGCTYRAIRRDALERIMPKLRMGGNAFSPHMLCVALENDLTVLEVPVTFRQRVGESKGVGNKKIKGFGVGLKMLWLIFTH